ncbi:PepSY domain-containing protein [Streptomyces sp. NPDC002851]
MKRNLVIALLTAGALTVGGTAAAYGISDANGDDAATAAKTKATTVTLNEHDDDGDRDDDARDDRDDRDDAREAREAQQPRKDVKVSAQDAISAALKAVPGGTVTSAELDDADDADERAVWEIEILGSNDTWHDVDVDPASGKVVGKHTDKDDDAEDVREARTALKNVSTDAAAAAKSASGKGFVSSVDLEDRGWEITLGADD